MIDWNHLPIPCDNHRYRIWKIFCAVYIMIFRRTWCKGIRLLWLCSFYFFVGIYLSNWFEYLLCWLSMGHYHLHNTLNPILIYLFASLDFNHSYSSWVGTHLIVAKILGVIILWIFFRFLRAWSWNLHTHGIGLKYKFEILLLSIFLMRCTCWSLNTCSWYLFIRVNLLGLGIRWKNQTTS